MKKFFIIFGILIIISVVCVSVFGAIGKSESGNQNYLRIHIRANSNSDEDQGVKFAVKESVVSYLSPYLKKVQSVEEAMNIVQSKLRDIEKVSNGVLKKNGFSYSSRARLATEEFPTRSYEGLTLEEGIYDALIIELGSGTGNNWWCIVYPPLCFVSKNDSSGKITYKSLVYEVFVRDEEY